MAASTLLYATSFGTLQKTVALTALLTEEMTFLRTVEVHDRIKNYVITGEGAVKKVAVTDYRYNIDQTNLTQWHLSPNCLLYTSRCV